MYYYCSIFFKCWNQAVQNHTFKNLSCWIYVCANCNAVVSTSTTTDMTKSHDRIRYHWHCIFDILKRRKTYTSYSKIRNTTALKFAWKTTTVAFWLFTYYIPMIFTLPQLHSPFVSVISLYQTLNTSVKRSSANVFFLVDIFIVISCDPIKLVKLAAGTYI